MNDRDPHAIASITSVGQGRSPSCAGGRELDGRSRRISLGVLTEEMNTASQAELVDERLGRATSRPVIRAAHRDVAP
jgi:hypothetical protein